MSISELLRNLPRNKQYLISQGNTAFTMNDQVRNKIVQVNLHEYSKRYCDKECELLYSECYETIPSKYI